MRTKFMLSIFITIFSLSEVIAGTNYNFVLREKSTFVNVKEVFNWDAFKLNTHDWTMGLIIKGADFYEVVE